MEYIELEHFNCAYMINNYIESDKINFEKNINGITYNYKGYIKK